MAPAIVNLIGIGAALVGGWLTKRVSKKKGSSKHKALSPAVALLVPTLVQVLGGDSEGTEQVVAAGAGDGALAVAIHSIAKNVQQLVKG